MRLKQEAKVRKAGALASFVVATTAFNSPHDRGRYTQVLLAPQRAFEMLLEAALVQTGTSVFDKKRGGPRASTTAATTLVFPEKSR